MAKSRAWGAVFVAAVACGSGRTTQQPANGAAPGGPVGTACIPNEELSPVFTGFNEQEVTVEPNSDCAGVCLVNHFRGRVTCPYGQDANGKPPPGASACSIPGAVTHGPIVSPDPRLGQLVQPQCVDRNPRAAVTCSCRCANADRRTDDGAPYCACPSGFDCVQVVPELVAGDSLAGGYCISHGAAYDQNSACSVTCDPAVASARCEAPDAGVPSGGDGATPYFTANVRLQGGLCLPAPLPREASGQADCEIFFLLPAGDTCAAHPGLSAPDARVAAVILASAAAPAGQPVCLFAQIPAPCSAASQPGWCYLTGANAPSGCGESIGVSPTGPPPNSAAVLACP